MRCQKGTKMEKYVLNWALENLIPISLFPNRPSWLFVSYEELILDPKCVVTKLSRFLRLEDINRMMSTIRKPSRTTKKSSTQATREQIKNGNRDYLVRRWRYDITKEDERKAFRILERLGIDLYEFGQDLPKLPKPHANRLCNSS